MRRNAHYTLGAVGSLLVLTACAAVGAAPTDNPVATYYDGPEGYPAWTDAIKWHDVIDMSAYTRGGTTFERFENARDELAARGGGVLYYPAGTWDFTEGPFDGPDGRGLMLAPGVVIRGEAPAGKPSAVRDVLRLATKFVFGFRKREVALEKGTQFGIELEGGVAYEVKRRRGKGKDREEWKEVRRDPLYLDLPAPGGTVGGRVRGYARAWNRKDIVGEAGVRQGDDSISLEVKVAVSARSDRGGDAGGEAKYTIKLTRAAGDPKRLEGSFTGAFLGRMVKGVARGRFVDVKPETPRDWNIVGLSTAGGRRIVDVDRVGIAWVHMVGATVWFGPDVEWGDTWRTAGSWKSAYVKDSWAARRPDGTHPWDPFAGGGKAYRGAGDGRLVFGCILEDAVVVNDSITSGRPDNRSGFGPDGFYMAKFGPRIGVYGSRVFVANNIIPKSEGRNFTYRQTTRRTWPKGGAGMGFDRPRESTVLFDYNKAAGVDVNKCLLGLTKPDAVGRATPGYFEEGVVVRGNRVYNHGHKGFNISGTWATIDGNRNDRDYLREGVGPYGIHGWELTLDGHLESSPGGNGAISDNLSRAFDLGGRNLWVHDNYFENVGSDPGNDGEGILCQAHGGSHWNSWAITRNRHERGSGESSYIGAWDVHMLGVLIAWNKTSGWVGRLNVTRKRDADMAIVANDADGGVKAPANAVTSPPAGTPAPPTNVAATLHGTDAVKITWADAADNEIGFRVERRIGAGPWHTIAYRPPRIEGTPENPQAWVDFTAPSGRRLSYRVLAISAADEGPCGGPTPATEISSPLRVR